MTTDSPLGSGERREAFGGGLRPTETHPGGSAATPPETPKWGFS